MCYSMCKNQHLTSLVEKYYILMAKYRFKPGIIGNVERNRSIALPNLLHSRDIESPTPICIKSSERTNHNNLTNKMLTLKTY